MLIQHTISIRIESALLLLDGATKIKLDKKDERVSDRFCHWLHMPFVRIIALMIIGWFIKQNCIDFFCTRQNIVGL